MTIVLIEDDDATRDSLRLLLECEGLPVCEFASCNDFLAAEGSADPRCLILDIHMTGMTGIELLQRLRARGTMVPAIFMTGNPNSAVKSRAATAGALAVFEKPFEASELVDMVRAVLDERPPR